MCVAHQFLFLKKIVEKKVLKNYKKDVPVFSDVTDAFSSTTIFYYNSKRYMYNQHFWKIA